jgi:hypothetical protein
MQERTSFKTILMTNEQLPNFSPPENPDAFFVQMSNLALLSVPAFLSSSCPAPVEVPMKESCLSALCIIYMVWSHSYYFHAMRSCCPLPHGSVSPLLCLCIMALLEILPTVFYRWHKNIRLASLPQFLLFFRGFLVPRERNNLIFPYPLITLVP